MKTRFLIIMLLVLTTVVSAKRKPEVFTEYTYAAKNAGTSVTIQFEKGPEHNHPLFAIWLADENGKYIQTLYVSESIGHGVFNRASRTSGQWLNGEIQRPATLPYWAHQRGIKNEYGTFMPTPRQPVIDAYTGATPGTSFILHVKTEKSLKGKYKILLELNQSWDWNEFWTNNLYPNDKEYKTSSQPALVYETDIDTNSPDKTYTMKPIGHSHYSGADGSLNPDLGTITTALKIAKNITVTLK
ncbi:MAG: hypothetical protein WCS79_00875 [Paludibacter sp.]